MAPIRPHAVLARALEIISTLTLAVPALAAARLDGPVIDMHVHAWPLELPSGTPICAGDQALLVPTLDPREPFDPVQLDTCEDPLRAPDSDEALMRETLAELQRWNIRHAVVDGSAPRRHALDADNAARFLRLSQEIARDHESAFGAGDVE